MKKTSVVFEKLRLAHLPLLFYYRYVLRRDIVVFNFDHDYHRSKILRKLVHSSNVLILLNNLESTPRHKEAIDYCAQIEPSVAQWKSLETFSKDISHKDIACIYQKNIVRSIYVALEILDYLKDHPQSTLIPDIKFFSAKKLHSKMRNLPHSSLIGEVFFYLEILKWNVLAPLFFIFKLLSRRTPKLKEQKNYRFAFSISSLFQIKFEGKRSFDFILDHEKITKENSVFLVECDIPQTWLESKRKLGYNIVKIDENQVSNSAASIKGTIRALLEIMLLHKKEPNLTKSSLTLLRSSLYWNQICDTIYFDNYIYTNNESPSQISKNGIFRSLGIKTWNYSSFTGGALLYSSTRDFTAHCQILWAFQNPTYYLAVNQDVVSYYKVHHFNTQYFPVIGNVFSRLILDYKKYFDLANQRKVFFPSFVEGKSKLITFLDTTFINDKNCYTTFEDGINFYRDIENLLNSFPDLFVLLKPSKNEWFYTSPDSEWSHAIMGPQIVSAMKNTIEHPRCLSVGEKGDLPLTCALSDLVVTHCLSSPTIEALGAGVEAIWYESGTKHQSTLYSPLKNMIVHGIDNLHSIVKLKFEGKQLMNLDETARVLAHSSKGNALEELRTYLTKNK